MLDDAALTALGNHVPTTIYGNAGIVPTPLPMLSGAVCPVDYSRTRIEAAGDGMWKFRYVVEDRASNRGVSAPILIDVQIEAVASPMILFV
ncbi:hypothetical protein [Burkholderia ambifaria]|uniref:hypothetical protein n=1 Tax=Burkholderia ambifaria TaxID=152480 RepID=UPI000557363C|nr:hypothetical protein [Burkholderia ambifaria]